MFSIQYILNPVINTLLVCVAERLIFFIRLGSPDLRRHECLLSLPTLAAALVAPDIVEEEEEGCQCAASLRAHHSQLGRPVLRSIASLEGLWPNYIAKGEGTADKCRSKSSFCCTAEVSGGPL